MKKRLRSDFAISEGQPLAPRKKRDFRRDKAKDLEAL
jgi:hypothetical protein